MGWDASAETESGRGQRGKADGSIVLGVRRRADELRRHWQAMRDDLVGRNVAAAFAMAMAAYMVDPWPCFLGLSPRGSYDPKVRLPSCNLFCAADDDEHHLRGLRPKWWLWLATGLVLCLGSKVTFGVRLSTNACSAFGFRARPPPFVLLLVRILETLPPWPFRSSFPELSRCRQL